MVDDVSQWDRARPVRRVPDSEALVTQVIWTTVIQQKINGHWTHFSEQCIKVGEDGMSDREYLATCQELEPSAELRIRPTPQEISL
jgi:hypothetical protein